MAVRPSMSDLIAKVRLMIGDPANANQQFSDQQVQDELDATRNDVRYESLTLAPSIVNTASTNNQPQTIFADFYSEFGWWESDIVLQAYSNGQAWIVVTPVTMELLLDQAHFQFETNVFTSGTVPGQLPPVFATGKVYDLNMAAANLLEFWGVTLSGAYDVTVDGQSLRRSQLMTAKLAMSEYYRKRAKPKVARLVRDDVPPRVDTLRTRLLDSPDSMRGW